MLNRPMMVQRRSNALFRAAASDFLLREQLATDPANVISEYVHGRQLPERAAVAANHLVHALISTPQTLSLLKEIAAQKNAGGLGNERLARELARGLARHSDPAVTVALIRFGSTGARIEPAFDLLRSIIGALRHRGVLEGTEFTPGTGTEMSPGTGTEMTPGTGTEMTPGTGTGTEMTPGTGTGTEMTPGTGTEMTPGTGTGTGTEMTPGTGTGTGTEMTPGTGTEMTPGTGTEASLGEILGHDLGELRATLTAMINFAVQLRRSGALFNPGFR